MQAKVKTKGSSQLLAVTANRLRDGRVVWLGTDGGWTETVNRAALFAGEQVSEGLAAAEAAERRHHIVGPYAVEVSAAAGTVMPLRMRERLRVAGPSVLPAGHLLQAAE